MDRKNTTSLAEDISQIREALEGASSSARERTLKILERLTARLALAESERDRAMCKLTCVTNFSRNLTFLISFLQRS